jgi:hypothetical protein
MDARNLRGWRVRGPLQGQGRLFMLVMLTSGRLKKWFPSDLVYKRHIYMILSSRKMRWDTSKRVSAYYFFDHPVRRACERSQMRSQAWCAVSAAVSCATGLRSRLWSPAVVPRRSGSGLGCRCGSSLGPRAHEAALAAWVRLRCCGRLGCGLWLRLQLRLRPRLRLRLRCYDCGGLRAHNTPSQLVHMALSVCEVQVVQRC